MNRNSGPSEKEKYAQRIAEDNSAGAIYSGGPENSLNAKSKVPLGKYVT